MNGVQGMGTDRIFASYNSSVLKLELNAAKRMGAAETQLIDAVGQVASGASAGNAEGVGENLDVQA